MWTDFQDLPKLIAGMLKSKELVLKTIITDIEKSEKATNGLRKCCDSVINNPSDENLRKMVNTTMKCVANQSDVITRLCVIALLYCGGDNYDSDAAIILNKLGHGKAAMQELFRNKMKGR